MVGWYNNYPGYNYVFDPYLKRSAIYSYAPGWPGTKQFVTYGPVSQIFASNALSIGLFHYVYSLDWNLSFAVCNTVNRQRPRVQFYRAASAEYGLNQGEFGVVFFKTTEVYSGDGIRTISASEYATNTWFYSSFSATMNGGQIDIVPYNRGRRLSGKSINVPDSSSDPWNIRLCGDVLSGDDRAAFWDGYVADVMIWTRILNDSEHAALADPDNVDLRVPGGPPLILHERTFWPGFSFKASQVFSRRSRSSRAGSRSSLV
jgi:hypothetical protein